MKELYLEDMASYPHNDNVAHSLNAITKYLDEQHEKSGTHDHKWVPFSGNAQECEICHIIQIND